MKKELELQSPGTSRIFVKLTIIGALLLGSMYGFLMLFNTALAALK
jgi:hypothetical protein